MKPGPSQQGVVAVRRWTPGDDAFVAELSDQAFAEYGAGASRYLLRVTHRAGVRTWIAVDGDAPVGLLVLGRAPSTWWVLAVAVAARARARGIGGRLMQVAERHAAAQGAKQLHLFTADSNLAALDLFLRRGFRIVARQARFYARGQAACKMEKRLG